MPAIATPNLPRAERIEHCCETFMSFHHPSHSYKSASHIFGAQMPDGYDSFFKEINDAYLLCSDASFVSHCLDSPQRREKVLPRPDSSSGQFQSFNLFVNSSIGILLSVNDQDKSTLPDAIVNSIAERIAQRFPSTHYPDVRADKSSALFMMTLAMLHYLMERNAAFLAVFLKP